MQLHRWTDQRTCGKVLQRHGVVLERGEAVAHCGVSRVAGFGEECKIGQLQLARQLLCTLNAGLHCLPGEGPVPQGCTQQQRSRQQQRQGAVA